MTLLVRDKKWVIYMAIRKKVVCKKILEFREDINEQNSCTQKHKNADSHS